MNAFIIYWLPKLEHNAYNLISFQSDAYTNAAKLTVTPAPDSDAKKVVKIMSDNFYQKISGVPSLAAMKGDKEKLLQTVTLASIIEREYRSADEAPLIGSVFSNRIKKRSLKYRDLFINTLLYSPISFLTRVR